MLGNAPGNTHPIGRKVEGTEVRAVTEDMCAVLIRKPLFIESLVVRPPGKHFSVKTLEPSIVKPNISWKERIL